MSGNVSGCLREQSHDGECGDALAATGFAYDAKRRTACEIKIDGVDGMRGAPAIPMEHDLEVLDVDQRNRGHGWPPTVCVRAISRSMMARSVVPTGSRWLGRKRRKIVQRSRLTRSRRSSSVSGSA